jgi:hypothetical protein
MNLTKFLKHPEFFHNFQSVPIKGVPYTVITIGIFGTNKHKAKIKTQKIEAAIGR